MLAALRRAAESGQGAVLLVAGERLPDLKKALREELFHYQLVAAYHPTEDFDFEDDPDKRAAKIGAYLASGDWEAPGLTEPQAKTLAYRYARLRHVSAARLRLTVHARKLMRAGALRY